MGGLSAICEVLSFESAAGIEVGWMRKWCWQGSVVFQAWAKGRMYGAGANISAPLALLLNVLV